MGPQWPVPMLARQVEQIPAASSCGGGCRYEPKWDGFRALAVVDDDRGVRLVSRRGKMLTPSFPELQRALFEHLPAGTIVDGEIVVWSPSGRLDFGTLQTRNLTRGATAHRLAAEHPAYLITFDVLRHQRTDTTGLPLSERRAVLEEIFAGIPGASLLALGLHTDDQALALQWFDQLAAVGVEGIIVKPAASRYRPGDRTTWAKIKHYTSTEVIVGGVTGTIGRPVELLLARYARPDHTLHVVGRTVPLKARDSAAVAAYLTPAGDDHPWPDRIAVGWPAADRITDYIKVKPTLVVEVRIDVAAQGGRWRHGLRFLRIRAELRPRDVPTDLDTA